MTQATLPFGEWRPDLALRDSEFAAEANNVFPGSNSYLPMPSPQLLSVQTIASGGDDSFTKVLLHFQGVNLSTSVFDFNVGGTAHTWTAAGDAKISTGNVKFGIASAAFDGTGDWFTTPDSVHFTLGASNFTNDLQVAPNVNGSLLYIA